MTKAAAMKRASERARKVRSERYVIWSVEETDSPGEHYHVSSADDLDGFYSGTGDASIVACFGPDGEVCQ